MLNLARARNGGESLSLVGYHSDCAAVCQFGTFQAMQEVVVYVSEGRPLISVFFLQRRV